MFFAAKVLTEAHGTTGRRAKGTEGAGCPMGATRGAEAGLTAKAAVDAHLPTAIVVIRALRLTHLMSRFITGRHPRMPCRCNSLA